MPVAKTNRLSISYQQSGSGPDVVMVHGLAANLAFWYLKIVPHFTPSYHTTVYDLRGHGRSEMPPTGYTTRDLFLLPTTFFAVVRRRSKVAPSGFLLPFIIPQACPRVDDTWILRAAERPPDSPRFLRWSSGGGHESSPRCSALKSRQIRRSFR
jgi:alpha-beta hydrolase superfamily lysophospholipase